VTVPDALPLAFPRKDLKMESSQPAREFVLNVFFGATVTILVALDLVAAEAFVTHGEMSPLLASSISSGAPAMDAPHRNAAIAIKQLAAESIFQVARAPACGRCDLLLDGLVDQI
jgi:hypothetical protein